MRACPACGSEASTNLPKFARDEWRIHRCDGCGFVYLKNPPEYGALVDEHAWEKQLAKERKRKEEDRSVFRAVDKATAFRWKFRGDQGDRYRKVFGAGTVLDVGCGRGTVLPEPITPYGIELSAALHERADAHMRGRGGYCVFGEAIAKLGEFPEGFFDGVLMSSILEHETDPKALLAAVRRVLKPTGKLYLKLPNFNVSNRRILGARWPGFRYPGHVNYFTVPHLKVMAEETGYQFEQLRPFVPFSDNIHALLTPTH